MKNGRAVKGQQFASFRDVGDPVRLARTYDAQGADELLLLDITAHQESRGALFGIVAATAEECFMPLTVGGGVRSVEDVRALLLGGADRICINTAAVAQPELIRRLADRFGSQCVVVSIDVRTPPHGAPEVYVLAGQQPTGLDPVAWAVTVAGHGAGEILLTSIDRDGSRQGYDLGLVRSVARAVDIPVIAAGGAGTLQDLVEAITQGQASAVSAGTIFHFTDQSIIKARSYMLQAGLNVRLG